MGYKPVAAVEVVAECMMAAVAVDDSDAEEWLHGFFRRQSLCEWRERRYR
jgi:hypothetical protein